MYEFQDPTRLTRIAIGVLAVYLALTAAIGLLALATMLGAPPESLLPGFGSGPVGILVSLFLLALFASYIVVGRWIYVANANAQTLSNDMTITSGWAVGWFFVPIANLFKPYQAMKETWAASHIGREEDDTPLLAWWVLWVVSNFVGSASNRLGSPDTLAWMDVVGAGLDVAVTLLLIKIMRRLAAAQLDTHRWEVFA